MRDRNLPRPAGDTVSDGVPATEEVRDEALRTGDPGVADMPMPDRPWAAEDWGTTAREDSEGEPLDVRLAREIPDEAPPSSGRRLFEPNADGGLFDAEDDAIGEAEDARYDSLTAEEAAMRVQEDERGLGLSYGDSPGYVDG